MNTKQLRQKILDLAIRGKLVPYSTQMTQINTDKKKSVKILFNLCHLCAKK
jgi:hypothetical protein